MWTNLISQEEIITTNEEVNFQPLGSLLADDMGLGKTLQAIALISSTLPSLQQYKDEEFINISRLPSPKPQELKDKFISEFDPDDPALRISHLKDFISKFDVKDPNVRIADLKEFINQVKPSIQIPNKIRLPELREMALNLIEPPRGRSPKCSESRFTNELKDKFISEFDPDDPALRISDLKDFISKFDVKDPNVRIADLKEFINQVEPSIQIPNKIRLQELQEMALNLIEPPRGRSPKRSESRFTDELKDKFISEFDPDDPALRISDLKDFISKVDPNIQLPNR
ncbi:hypothetical protein BY996DRAFT_6477221 [Phakopsora pachyrhizi]|nr:hypothetical protein BY996DRAFT_6477221 [Phakopsora pachyrhizi]